MRQIKDYQIIPTGKKYFWKAKVKSKVAQSCPTLCDPMDCSLPGSSVHGIFQARVLEWVAILLPQLGKSTFRSVFFSNSTCWSVFWLYTINLPKFSDLSEAAPWMLNSILRREPRDFFLLLKSPKDELLC